MKKSKSSASNVGGRAKVTVDRAETYPGKDHHDQVGGSKNPTAANAAYNRRSVNSRNSGGGAGGTGVIKWLKHITDAAESYKNKDAGKGKKTQPSAVDSPSAQLSTVDEMLVMDRTLKNVDGGENSQRQEYDEANDGRHGIQQQQKQQLHQSDSCREPVGRVEVMSFETTQLVQPDEVKVSLTRIIDKEENQMNPIELVKEKNRKIEAALIEKKHLLARILQIPVEDYDHISEVVDEMKSSSDAKELILSSLTQADKLTRLISEQLDSNLLIHEDAEEIHDMSEMDEQRIPTNPREVLLRSDALEKSEDTRLPPPPLTLTAGPPGAGRQGTTSVAKEIRIVVSSSQLMAISGRLHDNLIQLMEVMSNREKERERLKTEDHGVSVGVSDKVPVLKSVPYSPETIEPLVSRQGECFASFSVVHPLQTELLEIIEPETVLLKCSTPTANSAADVGSADTTKPSNGSTRTFS